jgi:hypothetical protein
MLMKILPLIPYQQGIHGGTWARVYIIFSGAYIPAHNRQNTCYIFLR